MNVLAFNHHAVWAIYKFELSRALRTIWQSLITPVITTSLYFVVFGSAIGARVPSSMPNGTTHSALMGGGLPGTTTPRLQAIGGLLAGQGNILELRQAVPGAPAWLIVGLSELGLPFKGGTLVPSPDTIVPGLVTDAQGALGLFFTWPAGIPSGTSLWFQHWIADAGGPKGFAASNGLKGTAP